MKSEKQYEPMIKLGSLFDGSGGFPLAGSLAGITPIWSSEIEPYPLRVTAARFPNMKQLGSVTDINGWEIEPVDIITFGSPCQDLSVAGKQLGIHEGQRSNLFFEAIRIIKEMREADERTGRAGVDIRPRFAVWENVPGAFSSNGGEDFKAVLEAFASVCEEGIHVPRPAKWRTGGGMVGNGWSVAWRVYDAQYWGVPQRRRRIYLVADFGGERAPEILFECEGLPRYSAAGGEAGEGTADDAAGGAGRSGGVRCLNPWDSQSIRQYDVNGVAPNINANSKGGQNRWGVCYEPKSLMEENRTECEVKGALRAEASKSGHCVIEVVAAKRDKQSMCYIAGQEAHTVYALQGNVIDRADTAGCNGCGWRKNEMYTLNTIDRPAVCFTAGSFGACSSCNGVSGTLRANGGDVGGVRRASSLSVLCFEGQNVCTDTDKAFTLQAGRPDQQHIPTVVYDARGNGDGDTVPIGEYIHGVVSSTLMARDYKSASDLVVEPKQRKYIVRRLTPLECCRLQGFPDWWEDGVEGSDSARYKMWGNGIALPCAYDVLRRIANVYKQRTNNRD